MLMKKVTLAAFAGTALLAAAPAFADGYRGDRRDFRGDHFQRRVVYVNHQVPSYYAQRPVFVHRPVMVQRPVVVYRERSSHDVLGGLIIGAVLGAVIANHAGY
jgi:hypothetical protein